MRNTDLFVAAAHRPKYLVHLFGAPHLPPYTYEEPQLSIVERATIAFLDRYLKHGRNGLSRTRRAAERPGVAGLIARP